MRFYQDSNLIDTQEVEYLNDATAPELTEIEGYHFVKWDSDFTKVKSNLMIYAIYEKDIFKVTFLDKENNILDTQNILYNDSAKDVEAPSIEGYDFKGWDQDYSKITKDLEIKPIYEIKSFIVTFYDKDNEILSKQEVLFNQNATEVICPEIEGYDFKGWDQDYHNVKSDLTIKPIYELKEFEVKFLDNNNNIISNQKIAYGESATDVVFPEIEGYKFVKWDHEYQDIKENLEIKPILDRIIYQIEYYDDKSKLNLSPDKYDIETLVFTPNYEKDGYEFIGWFESVTSTAKIASFGPGVIGDKVFYARFEKIEEQEKIVLPSGAFYFNEILQKPHSSNPNLMVYQPNMQGVANIPSTSVTKYNWATSNTNVATVSQWSTITGVQNGIFILSATLISDPTVVGYAIVRVSPSGIQVISEEEANKVITYTVTFKDINGNVIDTQIVKDGDDAVLPIPPIVDGKAFDGWDKLHYGIEKDTIINAKYIDGVNNYTGKKVAILGDSISTYKGYIPDGYAYFYPYATSDIRNMNETWWMQIINKLGMELLINNSWSGSCVSTGTGVSAATNDSRLEKLVVNGVKPDVIIIFMGANDCGSRYVSHSTFVSSYKTMLDKIKKLCPDSEIVIMTLPPAPSFYSDEDRNTYNKTICDYANEYGCKIADLSNIYASSEASNYTCDSIHPKKNGMDKFYNVLYKTLTK